MSAVVRIASKCGFFKKWVDNGNYIWVTLTGFPHVLEEKNFFLKFEIAKSVLEMFLNFKNIIGTFLNKCCILTVYIRF